MPKNGTASTCVHIGMAHGILVYGFTSIFGHQNALSEPLHMYCIDHDEDCLDTSKYWGCRECPLGANCLGPDGSSGVTWEGIRAKYGWWRTYWNASLFLPCAPDVASHACIGSSTESVYAPQDAVRTKDYERVSCSEVGSMMARILPTMERALFSETRHARTSGAMLFLPTKECMYMHLHIQIMIMLAMAQCIAVPATRKPVINRCAQHFLMVA